ncbi:hypothetical protein DAI22_08g141850 [Oryza sativa Japonica Group]|nr:hypothetical protein DAI22_08g141850 [Oryza sativa Japonica Group]
MASCRQLIVYLTYSTYCFSYYSSLLFMDRFQCDIAKVQRNLFCVPRCYYFQWFLQDDLYMLINILGFDQHQYDMH